MLKDNRNGRALAPGRSTSHPKRGPVYSAPPAVVDRLRAAVWAWRLRVPCGPAGHRYMAALELQLAAHVARNLAAMLREGWPPDQAQDATREWLHDLVDTAATIALERTEAGR